MRDQVEHAKVQSAREGTEETTAAAATKQEQQVKDEGCPRETYAQL